MQDGFASTVIAESVEAATRLGKDGAFGGAVKEIAEVLDPVATGAAAGSQDRLLWVGCPAAAR